MKNQVTGTSKARAKATISSAVKLRTTLPVTDRSAALMLAVDHRTPRYGSSASVAWAWVQPRQARAWARFQATTWLGVSGR